MIRPYLRDLINNHKAPLEGYSGNDNNLHGEWKIQLTMQINFVSSLVRPWRNSYNRFKE